MPHEGLAETVGNWLDSESKDFRLVVLIVTSVLVVFVHGFLLRQIFVYEGPTAFMFYYAEGVISLLFGGPLCWFVVALMSYFMD
jgi:hypothetical protein